MLLQFLHWLESGEKTPEDLLAICLRRIAGLEPGLHAWVAIDPQPALGDGPLNAIPFGVKDIFETSDLPTCYGSPLYQGNRTGRDAPLVSQLRRAGAVLLGKTQTTPFASFDPAPTRNPRLPGHTPGGSSAGSAAAVAAGMVPFAIGSQTLGSVLRPASFCGVCGFKPSFGLLPFEGVMPFAPSLDTVGFFTQTAADMKELCARSFGGAFAAELNRAALLRVPPCEPALPAAIDRLRAAGIVIEELDPPEGWEQLHAATRESSISTRAPARSALAIRNSASGSAPNSLLSSAAGWRFLRQTTRLPAPTSSRCAAKSRRSTGNTPSSSPPPPVPPRPATRPLATLRPTHPGRPSASPPFRSRSPSMVRRSASNSLPRGDATTPWSPSPRNSKSLLARPA